jgi:hypothetical protein
VLFVESTGLKDFPLFGKYRLLKIFKRLENSVRCLILGPINVSKNIYVLPLIKFPFDKYKFFKSINRRLTTFIVKRYAKGYLKPLPILWLFLPTYPYLVKNIKHSISIYHCVDNFMAIPNVDKSYIRENERKTVRMVDINFAVSSIKQKELLEVTEKPVVYINNVGNFQLFNKALTEKFEAPKDIQKILDLKKPIVGYMGNLTNYKENLKLFSEIVKNCQEYSFVLIGGIGSGEIFTNTSQLKSFHNVFFLGPKDYDQLYRYFKYFEVAIIPRNINDATQGGFPLKYFEFLSCGIPTVITGLGNVKEFSKLASLGGIANTALEFKKKIGYWLKLKTNDPKEYARCLKDRLKIAKNNSWDKRMVDLAKILLPLLNRK